MDWILWKYESTDVLGAEKFPATGSDNVSTVHKVSPKQARSSTTTSLTVFLRMMPRAHVFVRR
jgi:hypothetical protein